MLNSKLIKNFNNLTKIKIIFIQLLKVLRIFSKIMIGGWSNSRMFDLYMGMIMLFCIIYLIKYLVTMSYWQDKEKAE